MFQRACNPQPNAFVLDCIFLVEDSPKTHTFCRTICMTVFLTWKYLLLMPLKHFCRRSGGERELLAWQQRLRLTGWVWFRWLGEWNGLKPSTFKVFVGELVLGATLLNHLLGRFWKMILSWDFRSSEIPSHEPVWRYQAESHDSFMGISERALQVQPSGVLLGYDMAEMPNVARNSEGPDGGRSYEVSLIHDVLQLLRPKLRLMKSLRQWA